MHALITNAGSAKRLEGKVYVITFFVSETEWALDKKMGLFKQMRDAESWLEKTAMQYGKTVRFVNGVYGLFEPFSTSIISDYNSGESHTDIAIKYLLQAGCPLENYPEWVKKNSGCDQSLVFIVANKHGRGYACPICIPGSNLPEGAILFHSTTDPLIAGNIIHEMLHLFGAEDLYAVTPEMADINAKAEKMFPKEVMHNSYVPLHELMISPLTAWLVGLSDKKEPWFDDFLLS